MTAYFSATRHPWACLLFLVPLLAAYEGGVLWLGGDQADRLRNGADAWLRWGLEVFGANHVLAAPAVVLLVLVAWAWWRWSDRPDDRVTTFFGMAFEHSVVNMFLFPSGLLMGGNFSLMDYLIWNEIPTVLGNLVGGLAFTGLTLYATHIKTAPKRSFN